MLNARIGSGCIYESILPARHYAFFYTAPEKVAPAVQQQRSYLVFGFRCQEKEVLNADT
jgi:hypothetical protein